MDFRSINDRYGYLNEIGSTREFKSPKINSRSPINTLQSQNLDPYYTISSSNNFQNYDYLKGSPNDYLFRSAEKAPKSMYKTSNNFYKTNTNKNLSSTKSGNINISFKNEPKDSRKYFNLLFNGTIGKNLISKSPFGHETLIIYADYTATGRGFKPIEDYMTNEILPYYANIHSCGVFLADQIQSFRNQSKDVLRKYINANNKNSVIFVGQGATSASNKLTNILCIKEYVNFYEDLKLLKEDQNTLKFHKELFDRLALINRIKIKFKELFCTNNAPNTFIEKIGQKKEYEIENPNFINNLIRDCELFKPIIFYSQIEHNSNRLPWLEKGAELVKIFDHNDLYNKLKQNSRKFKLKNGSYLKFGTFSAASNITGKFLDVDKLAYFMHLFNGFAFFDYAAGGSYLKMDMNSPLPNDYRVLLGFEKLNENISQSYDKFYYKDALFFSPHKFLGGNDCPGILVVRNEIVRTIKSPSEPGGGTVKFVTDKLINYADDIESREEGGTPDIAGSIRIGLAIHLRSKVNHVTLTKMDNIINRYVMNSLKKIPNLKILKDFGDDFYFHLPIYAFLIFFNGKYFHHNYISCLLNDLFGIQSRPGCSCAPFYAQQLLGLTGNVEDKDTIYKLQYLSTHEDKVFNPGFTRLNFPYYYPKFIFDYILEAIKFVAENAYKFIGFYDFEKETGKYICKLNKNFGKEIDYCPNSMFNIKDENTLLTNKINIDNLLNFNEDKIKDKLKAYKKVLENTLRSVKNGINNWTIKQKYNELFMTYSPEKQYLFDKVKEEPFRWFLIYDDVKHLINNLDYVSENELNSYYLKEFEGWKSNTKKNNYLYESNMYSTFNRSNSNSNGFNLSSFSSNSGKKNNNNKINLNEGKDNPYDYIQKKKSLSPISNTSTMYKSPEKLSNHKQSGIINVSPMSISSMSSFYQTNLSGFSRKLSSQLETSMSSSNFMYGKVRGPDQSNITSFLPRNTKEFYFISGCPTCGFNGSVRWVCDKCLGYLFIDTSGMIKCYDCRKSFHFLDAYFDCSNHDKYGIENKYQLFNPNFLEYSLSPMKTEAGMGEEFYTNLIQNIMKESNFRKY